MSIRWWLNKYGNHDGIFTAIKNHFLPPNVTTQENTHVMFLEKSRIQKYIQTGSKEHKCTPKYMYMYRYSGNTLQPASSCSVSRCPWPALLTHHGALAAGTHCTRPTSQRWQKVTRWWAPACGIFNRIIKLHKTTNSRQTEQTSTLF